MEAVKRPFWAFPRQKRPFFAEFANCSTLGLKNKKRWHISAMVLLAKRCAVSRRVDWRLQFFIWGRFSRVAAVLLLKKGQKRRFLALFQTTHFQVQKIRKLDELQPSAGYKKVAQHPAPTRGGFCAPKFAREMGVLHVCAKKCRMGKNSFLLPAPLVQIFQRTLQWEKVAPAQGASIHVGLKEIVDDKSLNKWAWSFLGQKKSLLKISPAKRRIVGA